LNAPSEDLAILFPGRDVTVNGETITVMPFYFGQHPKAIALLSPVVNALQSANILRISDNGKGGLDMKMASDIVDRLPSVMETVADGLELSIKLLMFALGKPREWFDTIPGDDGYKLLFAVLQENSDFFTKRILPMFGLTAKASPQILETGAPSSPASSEPATDGQTSSATH
jgi:hypothetical protein